ncbi:hypothetical protein PAXRUDRAFT_159749 [Paxillus rubicundulus Ve08.2h10]|uniref:Uncharacterized protein n=1 Tax=Paxillus rubicundulus Ve08.2h10 TaxID=930991 RepID=A0A0D0D8J0_9AGAM|nr:hypothetical protein PAXRUDRAFT_159749 [Paxillus rubicundulus Ve08.2h10]
MLGTFQQLCVCGCIFTCVCDFVRHEKGCAKGRRHLFGALSKAKEVYQQEKLCLNKSSNTRRRPCQLNHWLPLCFRYVFPEPPLSLPPPEVREDLNPCMPESAPGPHQTQPLSVSTSLQQMFKTQQNKFSFVFSIFTHSHVMIPMRYNLPVSANFIILSLQVPSLAKHALC